MIYSKRHLFTVMSFLVLASFYPSLGHADSLGQKENFFVSDTFDKYGRNQIGAILYHVSDKAYFYVDDQYLNRLSSVQINSLKANLTELGFAFDRDIYAKEVALWGSEPNPGIDGDPRITILLEELTDKNGGYVETGNGYSRQSVSDSNQREMVALNVEAVMESFKSAKLFLAHEFQHLISFNQKELAGGTAEDTWLNELRSEYSVSAVGYNDVYAGSGIEKRVASFLGSPSDSLTEWPNSLTDYGIAAFFAEYLVEQYGRGILSETLKDSSAGIQSLNDYFIGRGAHERFGDIFINWTGAAYLNDTAQDGRLGYKNPNLRMVKVQPQQKIYLSAGLSEYTLTQFIKDWQPVWLEYDLGPLSNNKELSLKIDASGAAGEIFLVSYLAFYEDGSTQYGRMDYRDGRGGVYVLNSEKGLRKLTVLATKATKISNFNTAETARPLSIKISTIPTEETGAGLIKDGALIKRPNEKEIYVVWGEYKRYLTPGVISLYGHLNPTNAIEVGPDIFNSYQTSNYVKYVDDEKVYAIWPDGTKHWMNITARQWDASSRDWNAIFTINDLELNYYRAGADIIR